MREFCFETTDITDKTDSHVYERIEDRQLHSLLAVSRYESSMPIGPFLLRRDAAIKKLKSPLTYHYRQKIISTTVTELAENNGYVSDFGKLTFGNGKYIFISPAPGGFGNGQKAQLRYIVQKCRLRPIIYKLDRYIGVYSEKEFNELLTIPYAVFSFSALAMRKPVMQKTVAGLLSGRKIAIPLIDAGKSSVPLEHLGVYAKSIITVSYKKSAEFISGLL